MRTIRLAAFLLFPSILAFGQLDSDTISVTASRFTPIQPDQVQLLISVNAPASTDSDQVLAALPGTGLTTSNLVNVNSNTGDNGIGLVLNYTFQLTTPFSKMKSTLSTLQGLVTTIGANKSGLTLTFYVQGAQVSDAAQQAVPCSVPDLMADAQAHAKRLADAAGLFVGPILSVATGSIGTQQVVSGAFLPANIILAGAIGSPFGASILPQPFLATSAPPACSIQVKYKALRYQ